VEFDDAESPDDVDGADVSAVFADPDAEDAPPEPPSDFGAEGAGVSLSRLCASIYPELL